MNDFWPKFREYVNNKEIGDKFKRSDFLLFAHLHDTPNGTVDTNRNLLVRGGFLKIVGRGQYELVNKVPAGTTTTEMHELAYGNKLRYLEKVVARKEREKRLAVEEARLLELQKTNTRIITDARSRPCLDCKSSFPTIVMVFSYRQAQTRYKPMSKMILEPTIKLVEEIEKCDVICMNCNVIRNTDRMIQQ